MRLSNFKAAALLVGIFYAFVIFLPIPTAAEQPGSMDHHIQIAGETPLVLPPQEEEKLLEPVISKPWYKKWWVWTIAGGVAGGTAVALSGGKKKNDNGSSGSLQVTW